jgi:hypothetical protein
MMATAANTTPINRRQMREVKAPELMQFTRPGQEVSGVLLSIEPITVKNKQTGQENQAIEYLFVNPETGTRWTCLGTNDLNKKLNPQMINHFVQIRYETDDTSFMKQGQSPAKVFKVQVSTDPEPGF